MKMKKLLVPVVAALLAATGLVGCGEKDADAKSRSYQSNLEQNAKPLVNKLLRENFGSNVAKCLKVKITEKVDATHYKAAATLDNGNDIKIMIEHKGNMIYVKIPKQ